MVEPDSPYTPWWPPSRLCVPAYAGYATGFHAVQAYLRRTGKTAAEATLVPAAEILQVGAYFA